MNISSFSYLFKEGIKNLIHNKLMSLASIGVLTACLLVVGFSTLISENFNKSIDFIGEQSSITVFLKDGIDENKLNEVRQKFEHDDRVKKIENTSKEMALKDFTEKFNTNESNQLLLENNIMPASMEIFAKNVSFIDEIVNEIKESAKDFDFIDEIKYPSSTANTIKQLEITVSWFEVILILALIIVSLIIISNTIRATVFARRREIAVMKQVGATDNFVRFPFIIEGIAIGTLSACIAFFVVGVVYKAIMIILTNSSSDFLNSMFSNFVSFKKVGWFFAINFFVGGIGAGVISSLFSLKKIFKNLK